MREIIFRGKRKDTQKWVYGSLQCFKGYSIFDKSWKNFFAVDSSTVGQYTGLKDKNGTKIFEGDILEGNNRRGVVKAEVWNCGCCHAVYGFSTEDTRPSLDSPELTEIIGNIHDNPELLEVK